MLPSKLGISEEDNVFNKLYMINCNSLWICLFGEDWPAIPRSVKKWVVFRVPSNDIFALVNMFEGQSTWHFQLLWILWVMSHFTLPTVVLESDSLSLFLDFRNAQKTHTHSDGLTIQALNCTAEIKQNPVRAVVWQFHLRTIYWCWCYTVLNWCMLICWYIVFLLGVDIFHVDFHVEIGQSNMFTVCLLAPAIGSRRISGSRTIARREVAAKLQRTTHRGTWHAATRGQHAGVESRMRDLAMWLHIIHVMLYTYVYLFFYVIYVFVFFVYTHV